MVLDLIDSSVTSQLGEVGDVHVKLRSGYPRLLLYYGYYLWLCSLLHKQWTIGFEYQVKKIRVQKGEKLCETEKLFFLGECFFFVLFFQDTFFFFKQKNFFFSKAHFFRRILFWVDSLFFCPRIFFSQIFFFFFFKEFFFVFQGKRFFWEDSFQGSFFSRIFFFSHVKQSGKKVLYLFLYCPWFFFL